MKIGAENRKQMIMLYVLGGVALLCVLYMVSQFFGSSSSDTAATPAPVVAPPVQTRTAGTNGTAGHAATKVSNSSLDPTLHMAAMLLTESLEYTGNGRNIFSANSSPTQLAVIPKPIASARPQGSGAAAVPVFTGPPPPPPIDLKFFGIATRNGERKALLLHGEDVFIAAPGEIVSRRYKIVSIAATSVAVTDLQNNNTQQLPLVVQ